MITKTQKEVKKGESLRYDYKDAEKGKKGESLRYDYKDAERSKERGIP